MLLPQIVSAAPVDFWSDRYWDSGKAEFQVYDADISMYHTKRKAAVKLIYVKEPFHTQTYVKSPDKKNTIDVIKLNYIRTIPTGVYDYFQMASLFFDRKNGRVLKYTMSSQDGCGNTFMEYIFKNDTHAFQFHSYFDNQGTSEIQLEKGAFVFYDALPLYLRTRLTETNYSVTLLTSLISNKRKPFQFEKALIENRTERHVKIGNATYDRIKLVLVTLPGQTDIFYFQPTFPHRLVQWKMGSGDTLVIRQSGHFYYWEYNQPKDRGLPAAWP